MAQNLAQKEMRERQSPKGNVLGKMAMGAISDKDMMMKRKAMKKRMLTDTGYMGKK